MNFNAISVRSILLILTLLAVVILTVVFFQSDNTIDARNDDYPVTSVAWSMKSARSIEHLEARLRKMPADKQSNIELAQAYLLEAQQSLQETYYLPKAQMRIDNVLAEESNNFEALALQASLYNTLHQFEKTRAIAEALIERSQSKAYVYGILIDALVELGEYEEAVRRSDEMMQLRPGLSSYSRVSYLRELYGDTKGAIQAMELAAEAGVTGEAERSWALYQLGQLYLGKNDIDTAAYIFEGILDETPYYAYAMGGMAQVALLRGRLEEAIKLFDEAYAFVPADAFLEGQLEAYTLLNDEEKIAELVGRLDKSYLEADAMGENVRMEYADFLADYDMNLKEALDLAKLEYQRRPNHLHALETYAWALHKNGRSSEAIPYIEQAMRLETGDAMVHFRAGHIYLKSGDKAQAKYHFEEAIEGHLHIESRSAADEITKVVRSL